jgi:hypothetical protein
MRLRQITLATTRDLAAVRADVVVVLGLGGDFADPAVDKYGMDNATWPVGDTFLEVITPNREGTASGRMLSKRGDTGYMLLIQIDGDMAGARQRIADLGVRTIGTLDGGKVAFTHMHPRDVGGTILSLDIMVPKDGWEYAGPRWRENVKTDTSLAIVAAELHADDPDAMSARWSQVLDRPRQKTAEGFRIGLDEDTELRFAPALDGRGEGLGAMDVKVRNAAAVRAAAKTRGALDANGNVVLCGTRVNLVEP